MGGAGCYPQRGRALVKPWTSVRSKTRHQRTERKARHRGTFRCCVLRLVQLACMLNGRPRRCVGGACRPIASGTLHVSHNRSIAPVRFLSEISRVAQDDGSLMDEGAQLPTNGRETWHSGDVVMWMMSRKDRLLVGPPSLDGASRCTRQLCCSQRAHARRAHGRSRASRGALEARGNRACASDW